MLRSEKAVVTAIIAAIALVSLSPSAHAALIGFDVSAQPGGTNNYGASPLAPTVLDPNTTAVGLTRGSGVGTGGTGSAHGFGGSTFSTANTSEALAIAANAFFTFSVTPNAGATASFTTIDAYNIRRSSTGPANGIFQYQVGSGPFTDIGSAITWGSVTTASGNPQTAIDLSAISDLQNLAGGTTVTFRIVDWNSSGSGSWYINDPSDTAATDLTIEGTTTPEPASLALLALGGAALLARRRQ